MKVEVLGSGCKRCDELYENTLSAASELDGVIEVTKVGDIHYFAKMGVFMTPSLVVDGKVVSVGKVLTKEEVKGRIRERL